MDSRRIVFKETAVVAVGEVVLSAAMVGVFAALGRFQWGVLWGALTGCLVMIANHFFLAVTVSLATDRAQAGDVKGAKTSVQLSGIVRLLVIGVALVTAIKLGCNPIATILPLAFVRPVLMLADFFRKKGD